MPRNATAIALKIYFTVILGAMLFEIFPVPVPLESMHWLYEKAAVGVSLAGCVISFIGIIWPRARRNKHKNKALAILDGSVIEQGGLVIATIGMFMIAASIIPIFPMGFFLMACCVGFGVAFMSQWWIIQKWRADLRKQAKNGPAAV